MQGEGTTYAFSVGYTPRGGDHEFNFSLIGAGQWHHQAYYGTQLQDYLDYGPVQGDDYRKFNQLYGEYQGEEFSVLRNYYNKPLATFNWDWEISSNVTLATSLYGSAGRGGGTGLRGRGSYGVTAFRESFADYLSVTYEVCICLALLFHLGNLRLVLGFNCLDRVVLFFCFLT